jgi:uncharacterized membrane protein YbhN (UPF0104 family)
VRNWRALAWEITKVAVGLLAAGFIIFRVAQDWEAIGPMLQHMDRRWVALALAAQAVAFLFFPVPSWLILRRWQAKWSYVNTARIFFVSQLTKYLPGSIWVFPSRVFLMRNAGFSVGKGAYVLVFESLAFLTSGLAAGLLASGTFPVPLNGWALPLGGLSLLGLAAMFLLLLAPGRLLVLIPKRWRPSTEPKPVNPRSALTIVLGTLLGLSANWLLIGTSMWAVLAAAGTLKGAEFLLLFTATFALAWVIGFVVILSPGGVGVREGVMIALLAGSLSQPMAALLALASRVLWWLCELVLYFVFAFLVRGEKETPTTNP